MIKWRVHQGFLTDRERRMDILKAMEWFHPEDSKILQPNNLSNLGLSYIGAHLISTIKQWIYLLEFGNKEEI